MRLDWRQIRNIAPPPAPYAQGPTLAGPPRLREVEPSAVDSLCRVMLSQVPGLRLPAPNVGFFECYDPWTNTIVLPMLPSRRERQRILLHAMGHARGGEHAEGLGGGPWREAWWTGMYKARAERDAAGSLVSSDAGIGSGSAAQRQPRRP